jgi:hypothetical protein
MSVVNVKVANIRPQYSNLKEWMNNPNNFYIGRSGVVFIDGIRFPSRQSDFANKFKINKKGVENGKDGGDGDGTRTECIAKYKDWINQQIQTNPKMKSLLLSLKGKTLGCWCKPEECHGDVLLELIEEYSQK